MTAREVLDAIASELDINPNRRLNNLALDYDLVMTELQAALEDIEFARAMAESLGDVDALR